MINPQTPAKLYRDAVRDVCVLYRDPSDSDSDSAFHSYLERLYTELKQDLARLIDLHALPNQIRAARTGVFITAVGLLTYGQLAVVEDILVNIPAGRANLRRLARSLNVLLPLPEGLDPLTDPEAVHVWFRAVRDQLTWRPAAGKFYSNPT